MPEENKNKKRKKKQANEKAGAKIIIFKRMVMVGGDDIKRQQQPASRTNTYGEMNKQKTAKADIISHHSPHIVCMYVCSVTRVSVFIFFRSCS